MDAVGLDGVGDGVHVVEDEGQKRHVELFGGENVGLIDGVDVVLSVVGRESDSGERDFDAGVLEGGDDVVVVGTGGGDGKAAESVVASKLNDSDGGVGGEDVGKAVDTVLGGVSADTHVEDAVVVAVFGEEMLKVVGVSLSGGRSVAGGQAVSEADDDRGGFLGVREGCEEKEEQKGAAGHIKIVACEQSTSWRRG